MNTTFDRPTLTTADGTFSTIPRQSFEDRDAFFGNGPVQVEEKGGSALLRDDPQHPHRS